MKFQKYFSAVLAVLSVFTLNGCNKVKNTEKEVSSQEITETAETAVTTDAVITTTTEPMTTFTQVSVSAQKINKKDFYALYEAEYAKLSDGLKVSFERNDYSGDGYVTGFKNGSTVTFDINASTAQHYDLSFSIATEGVNDCHLKLNGEDLTTFRTQEGNQFTYITVYGVFLDKGDSTLELSPVGGEMALDYLKVSESDAHSDGSSKTSASPVVKKASENAGKLKKLLADNYGKYIITGQYVSDDTDKEIELVYNTTGKYPVIRFSDMDITKSETDVKAVEDWSGKGGISCVSWYWNAPSAKSGVRKEDTDFSLANAVTDEDVAALSQDKIKSLVKKKKITEECSLLISDIDAMAEKLKLLSDNGTAILWRPLPEGCGDWYWWGADGEDSYKWLWNLIYKRMTEYHKLDGLIWVWNGQNEGSMPDKNTFDIAAADLFISGGKDYGNRFSEAYAAM